MAEIIFNKINGEILTEFTGNFLKSSSKELTDYRLLKYFFNGTTVIEKDSDFITSVKLDYGKTINLNKYGFKFPEMFIRSTVSEYANNIRLFVFNKQGNSVKESALHGSLILYWRDNSNNEYYCLYPFGDSDNIIKNENSQLKKKDFYDLPLPLFENEKQKEHLYSYTGFQVYDGKIDMEIVADDSGEYVFDTQCVLNLKQINKERTNVRLISNNNSFYGCIPEELNTDYTLTEFVKLWKNIHCVKLTKDVEIGVYDKLSDTYYNIFDNELSYNKKYYDASGNEITEKDVTDGAQYSYITAIMDLTKKQKETNIDGELYLKVLEGPENSYGFIEIW